jgi:hypothetical protein
MITSPTLFWTGLTLFLLSGGIAVAWFVLFLVSVFVRMIREREWKDALAFALALTAALGVLLIGLSMPSA